MFDIKLFEFLSEEPYQIIDKNINLYKVKRRQSTSSKNNNEVLTLKVIQYHNDENLRMLYNETNIQSLFSNQHNFVLIKGTTNMEYLD